MLIHTSDLGYTNNNPVDYSSSLEADFPMAGSKNHMIGNMNKD